MSPVPTVVTGFEASGKVSSLAAGYTFMCAVEDGGVKCWGRNLNSQFGTDSPEQQITPKQIASFPPFSGVSSLGAGYVHSCAVRSGNVKCWGYNHVGQLGDGTTTTRIEAVDVVDLGASKAAVSMSAELGSD